MTLRDTIKNLCKAKSISLNQLETDLEFAKGYISKLDKSTPNSAKLQKIADYFGVTLDYLMNGEEPEEETRHYYLDDETREYANELKNNKEMKMLFDASRNAKKEDLKMVYDMLLALKRREQHEDDY